MTIPAKDGGSQIVRKDNLEGKISGLHEKGILSATAAQNPLVRLESRLIPAELSVLHQEIGKGEEGAWLNSRGLESGVADIISTGDGRS